jgi:cellulose biosynthesis protein BcsQ
VEAVSIGRDPVPVAFISHAHADRKFVEKTIRPLLQEHGIQAWFSADIRPGDDWKEQVVKGLDQCDWFMVVMSPRSAESEWVRKEVAHAFKNKPGRIIPVMLESCDPRSFHINLLQLQFADFSQNPDRARRNVISSMLRQLDQENREKQSKIDVSGQETVRLKEDNQRLAADVAELRVQLRAAELFDGNWVVSPRGEVPLFHPLAERKTPIVALMNLKGGVGKTTLTANLGATLWREPFKRRVLLVDLDYQGSLTKTCLDDKVRARLRLQERLAQRFFSGNQVPEPRLVLQCAQPITDRKKESDGHIVGTDENLAPVEVLSQGEWLVGKRELDVRYVLRTLLHAVVVCREYQVILLDCPPRLTTGCINALTCCDYLLIPVTLEDISTEGVPRLLDWIRKRKEALFPELSGVGVVANRTRGNSVERLVSREKELWTNLQHDCEDAWKARVPMFQTVVPMFTEVAMSHPFPAHHRDFTGIFERLVQELTQQLKSKQEIHQ